MSALAGAGTLLRFALRRERVRIPVYLLLFMILVADTAAQSESQFSTAAARADYVTTVTGNPGLIAMVGKAERGPEAIAAIRKHKAAYLMAVGGAAYLVSKAIRSSRVVAFGDLGMEAIYEFEVENMPVTVAVDTTGVSVHSTGPAEWRQRIVELKAVRP